MARKEIDLTGTKLHLALRAFAVNSTRNPEKKQQRIEAFERDGVACQHGKAPRSCNRCGT